MSSKHCIVRISLCLILLGLVAAVPAFAGSAVIGSVTVSMNATVGGQTLLPDTILFSGDNLQVKEGMAVVALGSTSHMVFGRDTVASFLRESNEVTVLLGQGRVSVFHDGNGMPVRMKVGDVSVVPVSGFTTLGEVATLNGAIVVTAKEGTLRVEGNGPAVNVAKGKTITVVPRMKAPQGGGGGISGATLWGVTATAAAAGAAVLAGVAVSRSGTASSNASAAESEAAAADSTAAQAASAAAAAASAAAAADSTAGLAASAAAAAAAAASSAAQTAASAANAVGCALDTLANEEGKASPYTPPAGETCP
jgi:hypothetical protein